MLLEKALTDILPVQIEQSRLKGILVAIHFCCAFPSPVGPVSGCSLSDSGPDESLLELVRLQGVRIGAILAQLRLNVGDQAQASDAHPLCMPSRVKALGDLAR